MSAFKRRSPAAQHPSVNRRRVSLPDAQTTGTRPGTNYVGGLDEIKPPAPPSVRKVNRVDLSLASARTQEKFTIAGNLIWFVKGTSAQSTIDVTLDDPQNGSVPLIPGMSISGYQFNSFYISNAAQPGNSITLSIMQTEKA